MRSISVALIAILALGLLAAPPAADAQQAGEVRPIGHMSIPSRQAAERLIRRVMRTEDRLCRSQGETEARVRTGTSGSVLRAAGRRLLRNERLRTRE